MSNDDPNISKSSNQRSVKILSQIEIYFLSDPGYLGHHLVTNFAGGSPSEVGSQPAPLPQEHQSQLRPWKTKSVRDVVISELLQVALILVKHIITTGVTLRPEGTTIGCKTQCHRRSSLELINGNFSKSFFSFLNLMLKLDLN